ncbi:MAG: VOC family protein [Symploca sp. SIO2B6]|nr:VOC family protein [Symploca sp. SIO2B6]
MGLKDQIGSFCWWSLMTKDITTANTFYQKLFDWTLDNVAVTGQGKTTIYTTKNGGFGSPIPLPKDFPGASHWMAYVTVADVDNACQKAESLGGQVCAPPFDIPTIGRTAIITDPIGAAFHIFTPGADTLSSDAPGTNRDNLNGMGREPGEICWMELMADDPTPLFSFYTALFGWAFAEPMPMNGGEYISITANGSPVGGLMKRAPNSPPMPPVWLNYFAVESVDDGLAKAENLGGTVILSKMELPDTGSFALIEDPTGSLFYLFEWLR